MRSLLSRGFTILRGVVYSAAFVWFWAWLVISVRSLDARLSVSLPHWLRPIGFVLAFAGTLLAGACIATFVTRGRGTPAPFDPPREFVASGPYRFVRNPMYIGATVLMVGAGLILSSPSVIMLALAFLLIMHLVVVFYEEPALTRKFGDSYEEYRSSVHRWLIRRPSAHAPPNVD
jgi:protein-S-isoprenylcysteine O-methyltransferase Ste14